jgi:DNA-binding transcriptional MerR regulator
LEPVEILLETDSFKKYDSKIEEEVPPPPPPPKPKIYYVDPGDFGRIMDGVTEITVPDGQTPEEPDDPEPHRKYNFVQWNLIKGETTINGKLYDGFWEAEYLKKPRTLFKAAIISLCAVIIILGISSGIPRLKDSLRPEDPYKYVDVVSILKYVRETELNLEKLTKYKEECEFKEPESEGFIKDFLREWAAGDEVKTQNNSRKIIIQKVDNAIAIRSAIIEGDIKTLQEYNEVYSLKQAKFKAALDSLQNGTSIEVVGNALKKLPNIEILDLDDVAEQMLELMGSIAK